MFVIADVKDYLRQCTQKFQLSFSDLPYEMNIIGNVWDRSGIAYDVELYKLWLNVMFPGAFGLFYGSSRTHHRVMVALEDAGWLIHKAMFAWIYPDGNAQGAQNAQKRIDDYFAQQYGGYCKCDNQFNRFAAAHGYINSVHANHAKEVYFCNVCLKPIKQILRTVAHAKTSGMVKLGGKGYGNGNIQEITEPMTVESEALQGYYYGLGFGKPILEPIIVAQAPYRMLKSEPEVANVIRYGTGVIHKLDRHPGNFVYMHHPECTDGQCTSDCLSNRLQYEYENFHYNLAEDLDSHVISVAKARAERHAGLKEQNPHPNVKPLALNEYIGKIFLPPELYKPHNALNLFCGSGSESIGLHRAGWNVTGVDNNETYLKIAAERYNFYFPGENIGVTVLHD